MVDLQMRRRPARRAVLQGHEDAAQPGARAAARSRTCCSSTSRPPGQDPARARGRADLIGRCEGAGKTIFLTTHNMAEAEEICDRVGFLAHGRIPVTGTPEALKREYGRQVVDVGLTDGRGISHSTFPMEGLGQNAEFLGLLAGDQVVSIHTMEASLDDVFIKATGLSREVLAESVE
jgi:ABC-type uncharacterized transport system ATPase subunit